MCLETEIFNKIGLCVTVTQRHKSSCLCCQTCEGGRGTSTLTMRLGCKSDAPAIVWIRPHAAALLRRETEKKLRFRLPYYCAKHKYHNEKKSIRRCYKRVTTLCCRLPRRTKWRFRPCVAATLLSHRLKLIRHF